MHIDAAGDPALKCAEGCSDADSIASNMDIGAMLIRQCRGG